MKRLLLILSFAFCLSLLAYSQDVQRLAERDIMGTARYVGMGGAMTAIGGDPSAVLDNPAGLGLYRRSEVALTIDETIDYTLHSTPSTLHPTPYTRSRFTLPHCSAVFSWGKPNKHQGMIFNNLMFSFNRLTNFNRDIVAFNFSLSLRSS